MSNGANEPVLNLDNILVVFRKARSGCFVILNYKHLKELGLRDDEIKYIGVNI